MRKILWIAKREYKAAVRTKGFIIGLLLAPLLMGGGGIAMLLLKDKVDTTDKKVAVIDHSGVVAEALTVAADERNATEVYDEKTGKKVKPAYFIEIVEVDTVDPDAQRLALSDRVRNRQLHGFLEIGPNVLHPNDNAEAADIAYHAKSAARDEVRRWIAWPINNHLRRLRLTEAGVDDSAMQDMFAWIQVESLGLVSVDEETGAIQQARESSETEAVLVSLVLVGLIIIMIMMGAAPQLNSVMEEKTQRIAEVMMGSVKPIEFMSGKILGGVAVSLTTSVVYVIGGIFAVRYMGLGEYIPYHILPWFFAYMLMAVIMFGSIGAALGAICNDAKDAQNLSFPSMMMVMFPMFVLGAIIEQPLTGFATWFSLIPPFTPTVMMLRMGTPAGIPMWQPWVGLIGVLAFTIFAVWAGGRVFRVAILMQGTPPKFSNLIRWVLRG